MMGPSLVDIETRPKPREEILSGLPSWSLDEAMSRVPKNYKSETAISSWIEADEKGWHQEAIDKAALHPETGVLTVVGVWNDGHLEQYFVGHKDITDEKTLVQFAVSQIMLSLRHIVIGWNIHGFDLPFIVKKAWMLGVKVPKDLFNPTGRYPVSAQIVDAMKVWQCGNFKAPFMSLNNALKAVGIPGKPDGKEFPALWEQDQDKALKYNRDEMLGFAQLCERIGLL